MLLYHGSYTEIKIPDLNYGRFNLDFGSGFYVTGLKSQSEKWAQRRFAMAQLIQTVADPKPIVSVYNFDLDSTDLSIRIFDGYSEEWLDFVVSNRALLKPMTESKFDVIFGNVADDDVAAVVDDYMRLLSKGRLDSDGKRFFLNQLQFSKPNDQYCIASPKAINALEFVKSYIVEG
ncbi:MAG: DUF3990 domain-containing protein [Oscillospiraceae bacterium]|nr:DUF3990 domain-containing protein [Oscillospiraceae bacterium]